MTLHADEVENVVMEQLEDILLAPRARIGPSDDLIRDLRVDDDDLTFVFIPGVERALGVRLPHDVWSTVYTVQGAVVALRAPLKCR